MAAAWNVSRLQTSLMRGDLAPLYFFYGEETFLIDEALTTLKSQCLQEGLEDFNFETFYGQQTDGSKIRDAIETLPMMADKRLIILKEAQDFKDKDWLELMPILSAPVSSTVFVVLATKIDKRKKFIKTFQENGVVVEFVRPYDNQIPEWIAKLAKRLELKLTSEAIQLVHQFVGQSLYEIHNELLKVSQYLGTRRTVEADDILKVVSRSRIENVFELSAAIGHQDRGKALLCLAQLLEQGQNEVGILALVHRHLRILKNLHQGMREGLTGPKLSGRAGVSPFFLRQYEEQARLWSETQLEAGFKALLQTDRALKSSPVASHIWLENFIIQTCA